MNTKMNLEEKVQQWFVDRNLHEANPVKQFLKLMEESGELFEGIAVVSPFVVQYGWNEIITTIVPVGKITVWQALGMDALLSFIWPVLSSKKESEEDYSYAVKSSISKIITCAFLIWLASLFI